MFKEMYVKITLSIGVVMVSMLLLQSGLNYLKFRSLVADATASRMQIVLSNIELSIGRAEAVGLAMDEMVSLQALVARSMSGDESIKKIMLVSPTGKAIISVGKSAIYEQYKQQIHRKVIGLEKKKTNITFAEELFIGNLIYDANNKVMGAIIVAVATDSIRRAVEVTVNRLNYGYALIFALVLLVLMPFIFKQFSFVRVLYRLLGTDGLLDKGCEEQNHDKQENTIETLIYTGNRAARHVEKELDSMAIEVYKNGPQ
jgi:hypothetical protein